MEVPNRSQQPAIGTTQTGPQSTEAVPTIMNISDKTRLLTQVRAMNTSSSAASLDSLESPHDFNFYSAPQRAAYAQGVSLVQDRMNETRNSATHEFAYKTQIKTLRRKKEGRATRLLLDKPAKHDHNWCSSTHLSKALIGKLNGPADIDASGCIYSPSRDLPRTKAGQLALEKEKVRLVWVGRSLRSTATPSHDRGRARHAQRWLTSCVQHRTM